MSDIIMPDLTPPALAEITAEYERFLKLCDRAPRTIEARVGLARGRLAAWGLDGMTTDNIFEWLGQDNLAKWSRATYHANLKDFCEFLVVGGYLPSSPMDDLPHKPERPRTLPRPLSDDEVARVTAAASGRVADWIDLALLAGLRVHEIAKIRGEDVTAETIYVKGKGDVEAHLETHPDIWAMAQRYDRRGWWFPSPSGGHLEADTITAHVSAVFRSVGVTGSAHRLRHTYATRLLRAGVNVRIVQQLMRHASLETTAIYTAVGEDERRAAINLLPSRIVLPAVTPVTP